MSATNVLVDHYYHHDHRSGDRFDIQIMITDTEQIHFRLIKNKMELIRQVTIPVTIIFSMDHLMIKALEKLETE